MFQYGNEYIDTLKANGFSMNKHLVEILIDETLIQIGAQEYWLRIAYGNNLKTCLMMYVPR